MRTAQVLALSLLGATFPAAVGQAAPSPAGVDQIRGDQWHLQYLNSNEAHGISRGQGVIVAVPDTGVDPHPDLRNNLLPGADIVPGGSGDGQSDQDSHGTGMAGLIAATGQGAARGALGVAPMAKILPIRTRVTNATGDSKDLAAAILQATRKGADIISISSVAASTTELQEAVKAATSADIVIVAAVGNQPRDPHISFAAAQQEVIVVGGIDRDGNHAAISVTGPEVDVVAPAVDIYSTSSGGKYRRGTGTSDATAIVAGAVALIRAKYPSLPASEVVHRLTATAVDKGPPGRDDQYGHGVIDLVAALTADVPPLGSVPSTAQPTAGAGPTPTAVGPGGSAAAGPDGGGGSTARGLATLGVLVAAGGVWMYMNRRRRRGDDPPPRISR
ncbi:S8 family serine peptidase [Micromonospora rosaria]|uniref:S8 family serine peptidase n=1 Tax=Micromonospora rosaria TaxID=47874 RepID=UPI000A06EFDD|nr:S8 family serine peptidase [Micromonospora rosaria]